MTYKTPRQRQSAIYLLVTIALASKGSFADQFDLDLESLMAEDVQITSAMRRAQSTKDTVGSIYVLSGDKIKQSGAQALPDMLRLVPGMQVRQIDRNQHAIGIRFAGNSFASKLLVMIDGHSIYNPAFNSTYWELANIAPEDIDRIEIIRGQTGTMWGLNALNGVINIITKQNVDHLGGNASAHITTSEFGDFNISKGVTLNSKSTLRVYGSQRIAARSPEGESSPNDHTSLTSVGARLDFVATDNLYSFTKVEYVKGDYGQNAKVVDLATNLTATKPETIKRDRITATGRLEHRINENADQMLQVNYAKFSGQQLFSTEDHLSLDFDYQLNTMWHDHRIDIGLSYRHNEVSVANGVRTFDLGATNQITTFGVFAQGQFNFFDERLQVIVGNLWADSNYTGVEHQPSLKALLKLNAKQSAWLSVSRAVRTPSYIEYNIQGRIGGVALSDILGVNTPAFQNHGIATQFEGSPDTKAEYSISREVGYRFEYGNIHLDSSLFYSESENVTSYLPLLSGVSIEEVSALLATGQRRAAFNALQQAQLKLQFISGVALKTYGGEASMSWQPNDSFDTEVSYSLMNMEYGALPTGAVQAFSRDSVLRQTMLTSRYQVSLKHHLFWSLRHEEGATYATGDLISNQLAWQYQFNDNTNVTFVAQNPFKPNQYEFLNGGEAQGESSKRERNLALNLHVEF